MSSTSTNPAEKTGDHFAPTFTPAEFRRHVRNYLAIFGSLLVLTLVSFAFWYFQVPLAMQITLGLIIAAAQAFLNLKYLMHLKSEGWSIYHFLILAAVLMLALLLLNLTAWFSTIPGTTH